MVVVEKEIAEWVAGRRESLEFEYPQTQSQNVRNDWKEGRAKQKKRKKEALSLSQV